jgi:Tfp pilus assembly PilM family ATPase
MEAGLMPQTVVGLDIGPNTIKAVVFSPKGLTGGRILAARTLDINACGGIEPALKKLAEEDKKFSNTPCCVCLPPADVMFRQVSLPFHDDNRIRKTLAFELEPLIPLAIDEVVPDYLMIPRNGLLVAALTKKIIRDEIEKVEGNLGNVSIIDISPTALASQILAGKTSVVCGVILDIGAGSTAAAFYENGAIVQIRSLAFGGEQITAALAQDLSVEKDAAEQLKIKADYDPASCATVDAVCRHFCSELKNTIEYMKLNGSLQSDPAHITITGGCSLFVPLQKELEKSFSLPLEVLDLIRTKQLEIEENIRREFPSQIMNTAIAAAMRISAGRKSFNFRQEEFAAKNVRFNLKGQLKWAAAVAGIIFLLAIVNQVLDYSLKTQRLDSIKKQISLIFKKNSPETKIMVDPVQQLKTKLAENKKTFGFYKGDTEITTLNMLKEISSLVAPSLDVVISNLSYENGIVLIKGEAKKIDDISAVKYELLKSRYFKDVTMGSTSLAKDGGKVDFDLRIELK